MARMYPNLCEKLNVPYSEEEVYSSLKKLDNSFLIFHSIQWLKKTKDFRFTWYENDFLILNKKFGILILEVKGGTIYFKEGLFHQVNSVTKEDYILDEGNDPLSQAKRGVFHFRKMLDRKIKNISARISIQPCIRLPSTDITKVCNLPILYEEARSAILDSNSFINPIESILKVFEFYGAEMNTNITDEDVNKIVEIIAPDFELVPSPSIIKGELENQFLRLTNEQIGLLDYLQEQRVATIQGAAGTGKTLIALEAARRFSIIGKKVLFLCFNKFLYEHLKYDCCIDGVDFFNIHSFINSFSKADISTISKRIEVLEKLDLEQFNYNAVIIDEGQDFENEEIEFFSMVCEIKQCYFYIFFDKNQLLTTSKVPDWINKSECRLLLTKNCRNTYEIACTSYTVIDVPIKARIATIKGKQPTITFVNKNNLLSLGKLIRYFKNEENDYKNNEITILSMVSEDKSIMNDISMIDGIAISRIRDNANVFYTTAKKFKGLESKVIIITDINESCFNDDAQKRVFYVACSRATQRLALYISGSVEEINNIGKSIKDLKFTPKGNIINKTRTQIFEIG